MFKRSVFQNLMQRLSEPRRFIQVLAGPRQVGKTTLIQQVLETIGIPSHYASADESVTKDRVWIEQQWQAARRFVNGPRHEASAVLVLDEIQKISEWSTAVKYLWDQDSKKRIPLHVVILGSAPLLIRQGISESLAGRFETIPIPHWSLSEMKAAFGWSLEQYIFYGGYPGSAPLVRDHERWKRYVLDSLVEATLSKDILQLQRVDKPALLKRLFEMGCYYSGQILSLTKMLGQLQDKGNTTTLAHYLDLLDGCGLLVGLQKFAGGKVRQKASSPKFQVYNNALITSQGEEDMESARTKPDDWGRLVESAVGAHLVNSIRGTSLQVYYWREVNQEVDFILTKGDKVIAIEVKSGARRTAAPGLKAFTDRFKVHKALLVGGQGIPLEEFLMTDAKEWV